MADFYKKDDLLSVLLALEERIFNKMQVASLGVLTSIDLVNKSCMVKIFPTEQEGKEKEIICKYTESLESDLTAGSIVVVLYLNKDSRANLALYEKDIDNKQVLATHNTHDEKNGVVIQIYKKKVV